MKIAVFHNFMDNIGGAEIVSLTLAKELGADFYTTNIDRDKIAKMGFDVKNIFSIGKVPINPPFKQEFAYWKFRHLDLGKRYNFYIIAGDWAMSAAVHNQPNFWYVYSPMREIFDLHQYTRANAVPLWQRPLFDLWVIYRRYLIKKDTQKINKIISISNNVQTRVKRYLGRNSRIIHPPTETAKFYYVRNGDFWLSVNRFINHKRVEMQMKAFLKLPAEKLIIVGSYEQSVHFQKYANKLKRLKPENVEILSWIDQKQLIDLYANCKGLIITSKNEDYGMNAVEAMASGKPVIAPNEGGYKETIIDRITGKLIDNINEDKLIEAIKEVGTNPEKYKEACLAQAKKFDVSIFIRKIKRQINS